MTKGEKVIAFIEAYCKTPEGAKVGTPLKLANFQKKFIKERSMSLIIPHRN